MDAGLWSLLIVQWPMLTTVLVVLFGLFVGARFLAASFESVASALGPLGKFWRSRRTISHAEIEDLKSQVQFLSVQVKELRIRDELYWEWILTDQHWHRHLELWAAKQGIALPEHEPFLDFQIEWRRRRGLDDDSVRGV